MSEILPELGSRVRRLRGARGLTQRQLAEQAGLSLRFLGQLEAGRANVSLARLAELADALGVSLVTLLHGLGPGDELDTLTGRMAALPGPARARWLSDLAPVGQPEAVCLVGLRGAGKSTVGARVARALGWPFVVLDDRVRARSGLSLADLFEMHGTTGYHRHCREALRVVLGEGPAVIEVGGSVVADDAAWSLLASRTTVVWLQAAPRSHLERVAAQGDTRPMAGFADALAELRALLAVRQPLYRRAHHQIDTDALGVEGSAERVVEVMQAVQPHGR